MEAEAGVHAEINALRVVITILSDPEDLHKQAACDHWESLLSLLAEANARQRLRYVSDWSDSQLTGDG